MVRRSMRRRKNGRLGLPGKGALVAERFVWVGHFFLMNLGVAVPPPLGAMSAT